MVRKAGFDPAASCSPSTRSARLSYPLKKLVQRRDSTRTLGLYDNQYPVGPSPDKDLELDREVNPALPLSWATLRKNSRSAGWAPPMFGDADSASRLPAEDGLMDFLLSSFAGGSSFVN